MTFGKSTLAPPEQRSHGVVVVHDRGAQRRRRADRQQVVDVARAVAAAAGAVEFSRGSTSTPAAR